MTVAAAKPLILTFDAAGLGCSVVVADGETVLATERVEAAHGQAERLLPMVDAAMRKAGVSASALDIIGTTVGPGSFTGVRVGLAAAHGIALATRARLIGVTGFESVAASVASATQDRSANFLLVALESRREDLYIQLFDCIHGPLGDATAAMPAALNEVVSGIVGAGRLLVAGDAAQRAADILSQRPETQIAEGSAPDATGVLRAVLRRWRAGEPCVKPLPLYLRPPDVTHSPTRQNSGR
jgi:tRNA threonylcarbamoyladenosine biosynthesis protein TsaB